MKTIYTAVNLQRKLQLLFSFILLLMKVVFGFGLKYCFVRGPVKKNKNLEAANMDLEWWESSLKQKALKYSIELPLGPSLGSCPQILLDLPPLERQRSPDGLTPSLPKNQGGW